MKKQTLNEEISRIKQMIGRIMNEDLLPSDFGTPQPHKLEDFVDIDIMGDEVVLYFNDETTETFHLHLKTHFSAGEPSSYDSPGYDDTLEVEIVGVKQVEPIERSWEPRQFEDYLKSLGCLDQVMDKLHDEDAYESAADRHYGEPDDVDLDEDLTLALPNEKYYAKHADSPMGWTGSSNSLYKDLPDGDFDDETYDDFDTLHAAHPEFHKHYSGNMGVDRAKSMFNFNKGKFGSLNLKKRRF
jgi:hypothetical protein